jgi:predicted signal transduction protein with EAL and GGDEF domain
VIKEPFIIDGQELHIGVSIGAAVPDETNDDPVKLLKCADIALYRAKQTGRGTVRFFEPRMDNELQARKSLEYEMRQALPREEFVINYQPLIDLRTQRVTAVEALLRWHHPEHGPVSPETFIPIAEKCGLIAPISEWVLRTACTQVLNWPDLRVAVNLSPVHFRSRELVDTIKSVLKETGLAPERLELEVTESVLIKDTAAALDILNALKALGVSIAMDDFGTGYSSLGYLNSFPFDKLKIDRSFISSLEDQEKSRAIVRSVLSLGESLQMTITAEGVEKIEQVECLMREGCQQVQGYFFGRPVPARELTAFLRKWKGFGTENAAA